MRARLPFRHCRREMSAKRQAGNAKMLAVWVGAIVSLTTASVDADEPQGLCYDKVRPDWDRAMIEFYGGYQVYSESGVDLTLLRENLKRTVTERIEQNCR